jgi:hypothetical protein
MRDDLSYLNTEYARNKMIEEYNNEYPPSRRDTKTRKRAILRRESTDGGNIPEDDWREER